MISHTFLNALGDLGKLGTGFLCAVVLFYGIRALRVPKRAHRDQFLMLLCILGYEFLFFVILGGGYLDRLPAWSHAEFWPFWCLSFMLMPAHALTSLHHEQDENFDKIQRSILWGSFGTSVLGTACFWQPLLAGAIMVTGFLILAVRTIMESLKRGSSRLPASCSLGFTLVALGLILAVISVLFTGPVAEGLYLTGCVVVEIASLLVAVLMIFLHERNQSHTEQAMGQVQAELSYRVNHDTLTGLLNRSALESCLDQALSLPLSRRSISLALYIDIDHFHEVNDGFGPGRADRLLLLAAQIIEGRAMDEELVFRYGEDKFIILLPQDQGRDEAAVLAQEILNDFAQPLLNGDIQSYLTVSIGIAPLYREDGLGCTYEELMRNLDLALDMAKLDRNTYRFFIPGMAERGTSRIQMANYLRQAIDRAELSLHFQPQVDVDGQVTGAEALLRWNNPVLGNVPPTEFISIAEESGLIIPVGEWVIKHACLELAHWRDIGIEIPLSINISTRQLKDPHIEWTLLETLKKHGLKPESLHLEITESLVLEENAETLSILQSLSARGFHISIDDFGTGYANLSYLKRLPVSTIKIDRSFITEVPHNPQDVAMLQAICSMAQNLGLKTIAEGVDHVNQLEVLRGMECTAIQGFLYSRPVPSQEFIAYCLKCA